MCAAQKGVAESTPRKAGDHSECAVACPSAALAVGDGHGGLCPRAVAADVRFSRRDVCSVPNSQEYFDQLPKVVYAHFYYNNWLLRFDGHGRCIEFIEYYMELPERLRAGH